jgi:hypothetical protein
MVHEYHVTYSVRYYPRFHVSAVGLGTYCPQVRRGVRVVVSPQLFKLSAQSVYEHLPRFCVTRRNLVQIERVMCVASDDEVMYCIKCFSW